MLSLPSGQVWWFEVVGGRTSNRPGAQRIELLWRAISKGAIVREVDPSCMVRRADRRPARSGIGGRALAAVTGPGKPVTAVVDMLSDDAVSSVGRVGKYVTADPGELGSRGTFAERSNLG